MNQWGIWRGKQWSDQIWIKMIWKHFFAVSKLFAKIFIMPFALELPVPNFVKKNFKKEEQALQRLSHQWFLVFTNSWPGHWNIQVWKLKSIFQTKGTPAQFSEAIYIPKIDLSQCSLQPLEYWSDLRQYYWRYANFGDELRNWNFVMRLRFFL